jgi:calcineurin-like phosphoesterase family protein
MDEIIIKHWNEVVKPSDTVWHLGDFSWKAAGHYRRLLNGDINLILGNHDYKKLCISEHRLFRSVNNLFEFKQGDLSITLCHFAMRVWNKSHFNAIHLFGHSHGTLGGVGKSMDVGVDTNNFYPYSLDEIVSIMRARPDNFNYLRRLPGYNQKEFDEARNSNED